MAKIAPIVSRRAGGVAPSLTLAITAKAKALKAEGVNVIGFGAGEPDFPTPENVVAAARAALDKGYTKYTESSGILPLRKAIVKKFEEENKLVYAHNQIIVSNGAKHSIYNTLLALINEGDEVLIPAPYWLTYPEVVRLCGGVPKFIQTRPENRFKMTPEELAKACSKRTKMLILNSPSNPTGTVYSREELTELGKVITEKNIWVLSDEIYEKLVYGVRHVSIASLSTDLYNKTVVVNGLSKSAAMTGWRIGYLAAPKEVADAIDSMQSHTTSNANSIAQYAALEAIENPDKAVLSSMVEEFDRRRRTMVDTLNAIPGLSCVEPEGAFYVMLNVSKLKGRLYKGQKVGGSLDVTDKLLDFGVAVVPGEAFGADDYVRLSYCIAPKDIEEGLKRIADFTGSVMG